MLNYFETPSVWLYNVADGKQGFELQYQCGINIAYICSNISASVKYSYQNEIMFNTIYKSSTEDAVTSS
jgi:hypothetical protein